MDWELDPISGRRAPSLHWSLLDPLDSRSVGDSKVVWELNRHQWMVDLGRAYRFTGEERYAETFVRLASEWMRANPPGVGLNWASSLEVALRLISWCWALFLFRDSRAITEEFFMQMVSGLHEHARHVAKYLSYYFSPNTHLTGEALGLFYAGVVFPELPGARGWRRVGAKDPRRRDRAPDSPGWGLFRAIDVLPALHRRDVPPLLDSRCTERPRRTGCRARADAAGPRLPAGCRSPRRLRTADRRCGRWVPLAVGPRTPDGLRYVFSTASVIFARGDYAWAATGLAPETVWLLGERALRTFAALERRAPTASASRAFSDGGYAVMRSGWEERDHCLVFDVGPLGCPVSGGHGHADLLSVECSPFGERCLVDPGMYCYTADRSGETFFAAPRRTARSSSTASRRRFRLDRSPGGIDRALVCAAGSRRRPSISRTPITMAIDGWRIP